ncbi:MAG TPA: hypothetical protein VHW90_01085 [Stellaceae bacterium]|jgi:capsular polysaccharide export protein|nr:hypothetical protein [Stellaceae bacterium]
MDSYEAYTTSNTARHAAPREVRSCVFLQGPISPFFDRLGRALLDRGHHVHRVNFHLGDQLFWRLPATNFRGRFEDWRGVVAALMDRHQITDLVLHGDRRFYHIVAAEEARARGIPVLATDLGYVRPDWLTLEYDGMTTYSRFPRDPTAIRELAAEFFEPNLAPRFRTPFWLIASLDIAYNIGLVFGRPLFPNYRYHSICHPVAEYAGWIWSRTKGLTTKRRTAAEKQRLREAPGSYFLVPLQLATDFQIRAHSPFGHVREVVHEIVASYARGATERELVFVVHPLDNGLLDWSRLVADEAQRAGVAERVSVLHGGTPAEVLQNAAGVITINSTVGVTALHQGVPVKVLGNAVFDVPGLTSQDSLDAFWQNPTRPDPALMADFLRALIGTTQVKGGYYERSSQACAVAGFVDRLERRPYPLPALSDDERAARAPRPDCSRTIIVAGVGKPAGEAAARAFARVGVRLCLIGAGADPFDPVAEDCRVRGAVVEAQRAGRNNAALADYLRGLDRRVSVDTLVIDAGAWAEPAIDTATGRFAAIIDHMRQRGRGDIVILDGRVAGRADAYDALRRGLHADGVTLRVVAPGRLASRISKWFGEPAIAAANPDRIAELIGRDPAGRSSIAVPGVATVALRAVRLLPSRLRKLGTALRPAVESIGESIGEAAEKPPLVGKSASSD